MNHLNCNRRFRRLLLLAAPACVTAAWLPTAIQASTSPSAPVILIFGDSLSAEYGLRRGSGWVGMLQERLRRDGLPHRIMNASISGETTAGGLARLPAVLTKQSPSLVILQLGANDGLRGLSIAQTRRNLMSMIDLISKAGAGVLLVGIRIPPNYGAEYTRQFDGLFADIARTRQLPLVPFLLDGIADNPQMFQADAIHPNELAQPKLFDNVWPVLANSGLLTRTAR
jgi:acyl-CoA thioesterase-1